MSRRVSDSLVNKLTTQSHILMSLIGKTAYKDVSKLYDRPVEIIVMEYPRCVIKMNKVKKKQVKK